MLFALVLLAGCAEVPREEYAYQGIHLVDVLQTVQIARSSCFHEDGFVTEQMIGEHPSTGGAVAWGIGAAVAHLGISEWLNHHGPRWIYLTWQTATIVHSSYYVTDNFHKGIGVTGSNC